MAAQSGTVASPAAYTTDPQVSLGFEPNTLVLKTTSGTSVVSFDGVNDHLTLANTDPMISLFTKFKKIWFKQSGGASNINWSAIT